jgi:hypothetical protein
MIDLLLNIGCLFDWITPTAAFIQDFQYGPVVDFIIPADSGWGRTHIQRLLTTHGIRVWGLMYNFNGEKLLFTVPKHQDEEAYYLLQDAGVPILDELEEYIHSPTKS